jgi:hypothetical protein
MARGVALLLTVRCVARPVERHPLGGVET